MAEFEIVDDFIYEVCLLQREQALTFADYLNSLGIKAKAIPGSGHKWFVCVSNEYDLRKAKIELFRYAQSPYAKRYAKASWEQAHKPENVKEFRSFFFNFINWNPFSFTSIVEIICVLFFILQLLIEREMILLFSLTNFIDLSRPWELYRLISPCFLHFGFLHIAFNLVMWEFLARSIERYFGTVKLFSLFLGVGLLSNILQLSFTPQNVVFGGLSGVVYGLIAYAGTLTTLKKESNFLGIPKGLLTVSFMFIGFGFFFDGIANLCHLGGFALGLLLGYIDYIRLKKS